MTEQVSEAVHDHMYVDISLKSLAPNTYLVKNETIRVVCLQTHLVLFIQWIKTCPFGSQSCYHFGRVVYLAAQRQYHCIVFGFGRLFPCLPLCFLCIPMSLFGWIYSKYVCWARSLCFCPCSAVCSLLKLTVSSMHFFSLLLFSPGKFRRLSKNACHSCLESV